MATSPNDLQFRQSQPLDSAHHLTDRDVLYMGGSALIDVEEFARRLRGARALHPQLMTADTVAERLRKLGLNVSRDRIYAWERGVALPKMHEFIALLVVLDPDYGLAFFKPAFRPDVWDRFVALVKKAPLE